MTVVLPGASRASGEVTQYKPLTKSQSLLSRLKTSDLGGSDLLMLQTKQPSLVDGVYRLNFHGRVTDASVKNFQLTQVTPADDLSPQSRLFGSDAVVQFGKSGSDSFSLDFMHPVTPLQAMALCLSQFSL